MSHADIAPRIPDLRSRMILAIVLAGVAGFAIGQSWPAPQGGSQVQISPATEDWHGNVRRSHWSK